MPFPKTRFADERAAVPFFAQFLQNALFLQADQFAGQTGFQPGFVRRHHNQGGVAFERQSHDADVGHVFHEHEVGRDFPGRHHKRVDGPGAEQPEPLLIGVNLDGTGSVRFGHRLVFFRIVEQSQGVALIVLFGTDIDIRSADQDAAVGGKAGGQGLSVGVVGQQGLRKTADIIDGSVAQPGQQFIPVALVKFAVPAQRPVQHGGQVHGQPPQRAAFVAGVHKGDGRSGPHDSDPHRSRIRRFPQFRRKRGADSRRQADGAEQERAAHVSHGKRHSEASAHGFYPLPVPGAGRSLWFRLCIKIKCTDPCRWRFTLVRQTTHRVRRNFRRVVMPHMGERAVRGFRRCFAPDSDPGA